MQKTNMSKKCILNIVGKTTNNKLVISGVIRFKETYGLPLDVIFQVLKNNGFAISWFDLIKEAMQTWIKAEHFMPELKTSIIDVFGLEYYSIVSGNDLNTEKRTILSIGIF